ncbi:hypothetical protein [Bradyrhizobium betae]|uniref:Uncharacterized protein n=1 Tax=Bradyrhizobium betae TaxID=244734 RepID=A0A5P6PHB8_9BRAD|nr:hypothetical protein [Bradyrhizobium betae]MCS3726170.1 hypothetical protein [Bradyrhizobium betae]QFI76753.1 hypothetical protein F8237_32745 [Bradyrhizobium betae]
MRCSTICIMAGLISSALLTSQASGQNFQSLTPNYQPHQQTDTERLQNFRAPGPAPTTYPNISRDSGTNEPRLNVNRDVSLGGNVTRDSAEGNVRFPIPGSR